jgi:hypothetical protein
MRNQIDALHSQAMEIADAAFIAKRKGNYEEAKQLAKESFEYERDAALLLLENIEIEPTRSILFRSAACLALDAEEYNQASIMIRHGLSGNPPDEIKQELDELLEEIKELEIVEDMTNKEKSDIYNIHFNDGDAVSSGKIALNFLAPVINSFNELRKAVFHNVAGNELELIATGSGSFNLFFKPITTNTQSIFDGIELENRLKEILSYSTNVNGLKKLRLNQNELSKFKEFLVCVRRNKASINFHFNSVDNKKINYGLDANRATSILKNIENLDYDCQANEQYHGYFVALDLERNKFKFSIDNEKKPIIGKFNDLIHDEVKKVSFSDYYLIDVFKRETKSAGSEKIKPETKSAGSEKIKPENTLTGISKILQ